MCQACPLLPSLPPPTSSPPVQHIAATSVAAQSERWTVIDVAESHRDQDLSRAVSPSTRCCRGLNRTSVRKSLKGAKRELVQLTYPTEDSITPHCVPSTLSKPLGRAAVSHHNYSVHRSPLRWCDGLSLRGRAMIEPDNILIIARLRRMQALWGADEINFWGMTIVQDKGEVIH